MVTHSGRNEPPHNKTNKVVCVPSNDSDQPGHPPSLIRVFNVPTKKAWVLNYPLSAQQRLWSDWADAQADLSVRYVHSYFVDFVMRRFKYFFFFGLLFQTRLWAKAQQNDMGSHWRLRSAWAFIQSDKESLLPAWRRFGLLATYR